MLKLSIFAASFILLLSLQLSAQGRLVMNNDAYIVFSNGNAGNIPYVVVDNPNANAITELGTGGNILSENEYHVVRWNIGANTGAYTIPFRSTTGNVKIPLVFQKTSAGAGGPNIDFSTYPTPNNNLAWPSTVTHLNSAQTGVNNSLNVIDRFWLIKANSFGTRPDFNMTFNYDVAETGGANTVVPGGMVAQRFNSSTNTWNGSISNSSVFFWSRQLSPNACRKCNRWWGRTLGSIDISQQYGSITR